MLVFEKKTTLIRAYILKFQEQLMLIVIFQMSLMIKKLKGILIWW